MTAAAAVSYKQGELTPESLGEKEKAAYATGLRVVQVVPETPAVEEKPAPAAAPAATSSTSTPTPSTSLIPPKAAPAPADAKADGERQKPDSETAPEAAKPAPAAPAEIKLKAPETSFLAEGDLERIEREAREQGLTQAQAEVLLAHENKFAERHTSAWDAEVAAWRSQSEKDPEIGGGNLSETQTLARAVLDRFDKSGVVGAFLERGFGNHPGLLHFLRDIGKSMQQDTMVGRGGAPMKQPKSLGEALFSQVGEAK